MNNILILFIIIIIFIIILFIDYNYCIENFAPKHKNKISKNKNVETFYTDQVEDCFIEPFKYFKSEYDTKSLTEIIYSIWQERESMWDYYAETDDIIYNHLQKRIENNNPRPGGESGNIEGWRTIYIYINKEKKNLNLKFKYYKKEKTSQLSIAVAKRYAASEIIFIDNDEDEDINKEETISFQNTDELDILGIWLSSGISIYTDLKLSYSDNIDWDDDCDLSNCINKIKLHETKLCNDLDKCRSQEVNGITSKYTIDSSSGSGKVHWINHNDNFYLNKDDTDATFDVTSGNNIILNNVHYCNSDDAKCPAGKYLDGNTCTTCIAGTYSDSTGATSCTTCGANTYSSTVGATSSSTCIACLSNSSSPEGSTRESNCLCNPGYKHNSDGNCVQCEAGTYSATVGATSCTTCGANKYSTGGSSSCSTCPTNSLSVAGSGGISDCMCIHGYYSVWTGSTFQCFRRVFLDPPNPPTGGRRPDPGTSFGG